jgi:hypothetical protein
MTLVIVLVVSWLAVVSCVLAICRVAARCDEASPDVWDPIQPADDAPLAAAPVAVPPATVVPIRPLGRRVYAAHGS